MPLTYTNPRAVAEFPDWPLGGNKRGLCRFHVEEKKGKGFRVGRTTVNPNTGLLNKTKYHTYNGPAAIVDGSDGQTYVLQFVPVYGGISIARHDFLNSEEGTVYRDTNPDRFAELLALIKSTPSVGV